MFSITVLFNDSNSIIVIRAIVIRTPPPQAQAVKTGRWFFPSAGGARRFTQATAAACRKTMP
jgi:hypothetical protein